MIVGNWFTQYTIIGYDGHQSWSVTLESNVRELATCTTALAEDQWVADSSLARARAAVAYTDYTALCAFTTNWTFLVFWLIQVLHPRHQWDTHRVEMTSGVSQVCVGSDNILTQAYHTLVTIQYHPGGQWFHLVWFQSGPLGQQLFVMMSYWLIYFNSLQLSSHWSESTKGYH